MNENDIGDLNMDGVVAWECEGCREWQPVATTPFPVIVLESGEEMATFHGLWYDRFQRRRLVCCENCAYKIRGGKA